MKPATFKTLPAPEILQHHVECIRVVEYTGQKEISIKACPSGIPGIVFQHSNGQPAIKNIATSSGRRTSVPTLFLYGQIPELSVMHFKSGPFTTIQILLKPDTLKTLFDMDASTLTNGSTGLSAFSEHLEEQLLAATDTQACVSLLAGFLKDKLTTSTPGDTIIEKSLGFIQTNINSITVKSVLEQSRISERQFQKRFIQAVGVSPQLYIRVKRFNEAMRLMDMGHYETLGDVAQALNFHDQSHFIHDIKVFSGITPRNISQKVHDFHYDKVGSSYLV